MVENYVGVVVELDGLRKSKEEEEWMKNFMADVWIIHIVHKAFQIIAENQLLPLFLACAFQDFVQKVDGKRVEERLHAFSSEPALLFGFNVDGWRNGHANYIVFWFIQLLGIRFLYQSLPFWAIHQQYS